MSSISIALSNNSPQCQHFVIRKKRLCRMTVRAGAKYCGEHEQNANVNLISEDNPDDSRKRMPCPLDPKHTCFISKLSKHLKICNARQTEMPPYIVKGCNWNPSTVLSEDVSYEKHLTLSSVSTDLLRSVVDKINDLYTLLIEGNITSLRTLEPHSVVKVELENEERGNNTRKHLIQNSALIHILEEKDLIKEHTCFVELGAGKGHLSYYLSQAISNLKSSSVLLVDRQSHRHKQDNKVDKETHTINRIRADICDLYLPKVEVVDQARRLVALSKHLCGMATDLAFRCITNDDIRAKTCGVVMATCCHHRCEFGAYVGSDFLKEHGIKLETFSILCGLVSWATCGTGFSRERQSTIATETSYPKRAKFDLSVNVSGTHKTNNSEMYLNHSKNKLGLTFGERTEVGRKAKCILDWGRLQYLRQKGFDAHLVYYVETNISPENICIVATKTVDVSPN